MSRDLIRIAEDSAKGGFFLVSGALSATFISAITAILVARFLGPELYGQYVLSLSISQMLFMFTNFGVTEGVVKFASSFHERGTTGYAANLIKHALLLRVVTGCAFFLLNFASADFLATVLFHRPELGLSIRVASVSIIFHVVYTTVHSAFLGLDKTHYRALTVNVQAVSKAVISLALILIGFNAMGAVLGHVGGFIVGGLAGLIILLIVLRENTGDKGSDKSFRQNTRTLIRYGIPLYLSHILVSLIPAYQNFILAMFATNTAVGNLKAATNFTTFISIITVPITTVLFPAFSKLNSRETINGETKTFFKFANKYATLIIVPVPTLLLLFSTEIVGLIYGSMFQEAAFFLSVYGLLYFLVGLGYLTLTSLFNGLGKTRITFTSSLISFLVVLVLSPFLANAFGVLGVILAFILAKAAGTCYSAQVAVRTLQIEFNTKALTKIYVIALFSVAPSLLALHVLALSGFVKVVVGGVLFLLVYATLAPVTGIVSESELKTAAQIIKRIKPLAKIFKPILIYQQRLLNLQSLRVLSSKS